MTELLSQPLSLSPLQLRPWRRPSLHKEGPRGAATPSAAQLEAVPPRPRTKLVSETEHRGRAGHYLKGDEGERRKGESENGKIAHGRIKTNCRPAAHSDGLSAPFLLLSCTELLQREKA